jgi:hypothetical protein
MAVIASLPSQAVIDGLRGVHDFYEWCGLVIVRSWPRQHVKERASGVVAAQQAFAYAHQVIPDLPAEVVESWQYLADQSNLTWKDWLLRAYLGGTLAAPGMPPV